jgi:hypothetical protein
MPRTVIRLNSKAVHSPASGGVLYFEICACFKELLGTVHQIPIFNSIVIMFQQLSHICFCSHTDNLFLQTLVVKMKLTHDLDRFEIRSRNLFFSWCVCGGRPEFVICCNLPLTNFLLARRENVIVKLDK